MGLRSREWFFGQCYRKVIQVTKVAFLANQALELGFGRENTQGHILQACGAVQLFLNEYPQHVQGIRNSSATEPFKPQGRIRSDWRQFFRGKSGTYGRRRFGYNWDSLRSYLTLKYGGIRRGGGGGDNEFEIVLRLMAEFL